MPTQKENINQIKQLPYAMKGYELYTWKKDGEEYFKIVSGTNVEKQVSEILDPKFEVDSLTVNILIDNEDDLKALLSKFPEGSFISVNDGNWWNEKEIGINEAKNFEKIRKLTKNLNIQLTK